MPQFEVKHMYPYIHSKGLLFLRYVDNIFMIWNGPKVKLISFIDKLNWNHKTIKSDYKICAKQTEFLDTMVYNDQQHKIQTTIFRQWTYQQRYLMHNIIPNLLKAVVHTAKCYAWKQYVQLPLNSTKTVTSLQKDLKKESTPRNR